MIFLHLDNFRKHLWEYITCFLKKGQRGNTLLLKWYTKVRREMDKYGCSPENFPGVVIRGGLWAGKEKISLVFWGSGSKAGNYLKILKFELFPIFHEEIQGVRQKFQVRFGLGWSWFLKINILNNRYKLLCIYIHILPQVLLNTLLNIKLWSLGGLKQKLTSTLGTNGINLEKSKTRQKVAFECAASTISEHHGGFVGNGSIIWVSQKLFKSRYLKE